MRIRGAWRSGSTLQSMCTRTSWRTRPMDFRRLRGRSFWSFWEGNEGQSLLSTVRNVFLKTDRSCRRIDDRCCCGESVSTISSNPSLPSLLRFGFTDCARTKGKSEVKRAAFSELRLNPYSSRMFFDHHLCNVESKSYTATILVM